MSMRTPTPSASSLPASISAAASVATTAAATASGGIMSMPGSGVGTPTIPTATINMGAPAQPGGTSAQVANAAAVPASGPGGPTPVNQPPALLLGATFECSLSGSVHVGQFRHLYDRLTGLCEHGTNQEMFEHEIFYTPAVHRPVYPSARNDEIQLRLRVKLTPANRSKNNPGSNGSLAGGRVNKKQRRDMGASSGSPSQEAQGIPQQQQQQHDSEGTNRDHALRKAPSTNKQQQVFTRQYQICQFGHQEPGRNLVVRSAIVVKIQGDPFTFLSLLGYTFEDEYVRIGYNFVYNNVCRISVFRQYKLERQHDPLSIIRPGAAASAAATGIPANTTVGGLNQQQQQQPQSATSASGSSTPVSSANVTPMATPILGSGGATVPTPTPTPTAASTAGTPSHSSTAAEVSGTVNATANNATFSTMGMSGAVTTAAATTASSVVEPPWLIEITSAYVTQENVNTMSEEINNVRALLSGSVKFNS